MTRIYLDVCCLNRPFDDQTQARIHLEAEAVLIVIAECLAGRWDWISSEVVDIEVNRTPDPERRQRVEILASYAQMVIPVDQAVTERAKQLASLGIQAYDALHLACAESAAVDIVLTTDDALIRKSRALERQVQVRVDNPLAWLREEH
jgi:predicted nucleic acid-binding protein